MRPMRPRESHHYRAQHSNSGGLGDCGKEASISAARAAAGTPSGSSPGPLHTATYNAPRTASYGLSGRAFAPSRLHMSMRGDDGDGDRCVSLDDDDDEDDDVGDPLPAPERHHDWKLPLKITAAAIPFTQRLHTHLHRHSEPFNEDTPWRSHKDNRTTTAAERKRYSTMWNANCDRYLELLPSDVAASAQIPPASRMLGLVVAAIWSRSNLPKELLSNIYTMVDKHRDGTLDKQSFVVGMWLIDQSLYGRKLPSELPQELWNSALNNYI